MNLAAVRGSPPAGWIDLSDCLKIRFTGSDRVRYLNGQVTNDVASLAPGSALHACVTDAKGRIQAEVWIAAPPETASLLLTAARALTEALPARMERYIVSDDVTVEDVSSGWSLFHFLGGGVAQASALFHKGTLPTGSWTAASRRFGDPGLDLWMPKASADEPATILTQAGIAPVAPVDLERFRISRGVPLWGIDLKPGLFPAEARLDRAAVSFTKGCYVGQEIISRMRHAGKVNRILCFLEAAAPSTLPAHGFPVYPARSNPNPLETNAKPAGILSSSVSLPMPSPLDPAAPGPKESLPWIALAFLRPEFSNPGAALEAIDVEKTLSCPCVVREYPDSDRREDPTRSHTPSAP